MDDDGLRLAPDHFNGVLRGCAKEGQWELAMSLLGEMDQRGVRADEKAYRAAVRACVKGGEWEQGLALVKSMQAKGASPTVEQGDDHDVRSDDWCLVCITKSSGAHRVRRWPPTARDAILDGCSGFGQVSSRGWRRMRRPSGGVPAQGRSTRP
jgi:pentatricopeptide repeat protein